LEEAARAEAGAAQGFTAMEEAALRHAEAAGNIAVLEPPATAVYSAATMYV